MWRRLELAWWRLDAMWVMKTVAVIISLVLFLYQTSRSLTLFTNSKKVLISSIHDTQDLRFPPLTICVSYPFDPWRLAKFGFNISIDDEYEIEDNLNELAGVDRNITGKQLMEGAMWRLGELVEEVTVGKVKETYTTSTSSSNLWTVSFTVNGPCFRLTPPAVTDVAADELALRLRTPERVEACTWQENGVNKQFDGEEDCGSVAKYCNTTCTLENVKTAVVPLVFLEMTTEMYYASRLLPPSYTLQMPTIVLEQYEVLLASSPSLSYNPESCMSRCFSDVLGKNKACKVLDAANINEPIGKLCSINDVFEFKSENSCRQTCSPRKLSKYWRIRKKSFDSSHLVLTLTSSKVTKIREVDSFPLSRLLSDIGGNLGLILGISLFSVWVDLPDFLKKTSTKTRLKFRTYHYLFKPFKDHLQQTSTHCVICCLLMVMVVHLCVIIQSYVQQEKQAVVSLTSSTSTGSSPGAYKDNVSTQDWMKGHLASRAFGCRVQPPTAYDRCLQQCFLHEVEAQQSSLLPYMLTDDLAPCTPADLPVLSTYIVPGDLMLVTYEETEMHCTIQCEDQKDDTEKHNYSYPIPKTRYLMPVCGIQLLCIIAGTVGLYFGLCFLDIPEAIVKHNLLADNFKLIIQMLLVCIASIIGATICMQQTYIYAFNNPVLTSTSTSSLAVTDLPALSLCPWPPVDVGVLSDGQVSHTDIINMSLQQREQYIYQLMNDIQESGQNLTELWHQMWTLQGTIQCSGFGLFALNKESGQSKFSATPFGQCLTCVPNPSVDEFNSDKYRFYCIQVNSLDVLSSHVQVHGSDINPFVDEKEFNAEITDVINIFLNSVGTFTTQDLGDSINHSTCMSDCLYKKILKEFNCKTPFYKSNSVDREFNVTGCSRFVSRLLQGPSNPDQVFNGLTSEGAEICHKSCKRAPFYAYDMEVLVNQNSFQYKRKSGMQYVVSGSHGSAQTCVYVSKAVTTEHREEFSGYTLTQLLSDMGGVGGFTLGMSLLTLLLKVLPYLKRLFT